MKNTHNIMILPHGTYLPIKDDKTKISHINVTKKNQKIILEFMNDNKSITQFATDNLMINTHLVYESTVISFYDHKKRKVLLKNEKQFPKEEMERYIKTIIV